jgi:hypothetical protein
MKNSDHRSELLPRKKPIGGFSPATGWSFLAFSHELSECRKVFENKNKPKSGIPQCHRLRGKTARVALPNHKPQNT